jgi:hypothetical protein
MSQVPLEPIHRIKSPAVQSIARLDQLKQTHQALIVERRRLLKDGSSPNGNERKLHSKLTAKDRRSANAPLDSEVLEMKR